MRKKTLGSLYLFFCRSQLLKLMAEMTANVGGLTQPPICAKGQNKNKLNKKKSGISQNWLIYARNSILFVQYKRHFNFVKRISGVYICPIIILFPPFSFSFFPHVPYKLGNIIKYVSSKVLVFVLIFSLIVFFPYSHFSCFLPFLFPFIVLFSAFFSKIV